MVGGVGLGFGPSGGGTCDYPATTDVRNGITFGNGSYAGNLTLPAVANVLYNIQYGANGIEFTGTLQSPATGGGGGGAAQPVRPPARTTKAASRWANQSVTVVEVISAMQSLCQAATAYDDRHVVLWQSEDRPSVDANGTLVWYRFLGRKPDCTSGAGRAGTRADLTVEINVTTRGVRDAKQRDRYLVATHFQTVMLLENAFFGQMLFFEYGPAVGTEPPQPIRRTPISQVEAENRRLGTPGVDPDILTVATMTAADLPDPKRPRPEQGYLETRIGINIPVVLRLTLDAAPPLES